MTYTGAESPCVVANLRRGTIGAAREEMGLPLHFVESRGADALRHHSGFHRKDPAQLVALVHDPSASFEQRLAAGNLLATVGDPRVRTFDPDMVDLPAAVVPIGTDFATAALVAAQWADVGVGEEWIRKECPKHDVVVGQFRICRYPVTNEEYRTFLLETQLPLLPTSWTFGVYPEHAANHPVWTVPFEAAEDYARWLSERTGRRFRVPTEAEWEYAATGGDGREFPWGSNFEANRANTVEAGVYQTTPVGVFLEGASPFGLFDVAGNVEEWVSDAYAAYPGGELVHDHLMEDADTYRVTRGGCFSRFGDLARCQRRHGRSKAPIYAVGFRLAETIEGYDSAR